MKHEDKRLERFQILSMIDSEVLMLPMHTRLCDPVLASIVYRYNLHGGIEAAIKKLKKIREQLECHPTSPETYDLIQKIKLRTKMHNLNIKEDPYDVAIAKAINSEDARKLEVMKERKRRRVKELHNKRECVCFY